MAPETPPGYPVEFERTRRLRDGRRVDIRPIRPSDAEELADAFREADADTLYGRFMGGPPPLTPALLAHLTTVDYERRFALVAIDPGTGRGVAIARYEPVVPGVAEVAVVVAPNWRRAGLATELIAMLAEAAPARGVHTFRASYLAGNRPVTALVAEAGGAQRIRQGIGEIAVALDRERAEEARRARPGHSRD